MKRCIIILFLISAFSSTQGQSSREISTMKNVFSENTRRHTYQLKLESTNELKMLFSALFVFYKKFVSSQDASHCSFTPSCSVYMIQAIRTQGPLWGMINGFDRLTRCNSLSPEKYKIHPRKKLFIDPLNNDPYVKK